jgi:iron-sulfur cluster repair protein YtfE (RIC family)
MSLDLEDRAGLPDALRVLLRDYPRAGWSSDGNFGGLVSFWLDRHLNFRRIMAMMQSETELLLDRNLDPKAHAARLSRLGSRFVSDLHGHHQIEDAHYFPALARTEPRIAAGFDLLDRDHQALDGHLESFIKGANAVLRKISAPADHHAAAGRFAGDLARLNTLLDRHLVDEEELVVPVILRHGAGGLG